MSLDDFTKKRIYSEFFEKVTRYVRGKIGNKSEVDDIVSDIFFKVYSKLEVFDEKKASLATWIYHITQNTVKDFYRRRKVYYEVPEYLPDEKSDSSNLETKEALDLLADALESLDVRSRNIIILHYYNGIKLKEIAEKLDISYIYVKVLHRNALDKLKTFINLDN